MTQAACARASGAAPLLRPPRELRERLGLPPGGDALLEVALTHRSVSASNNERLEFLGDALLGFLVGEALYARFPAADEGQLTRLRATLVNRETLASLAVERDLGAFLRLGEGEQKSGGWRRVSILANAFEALIGAVYLEHGLDCCRALVGRLFAERLAQCSPSSIEKDPKTRLQEFLQSRKLPVPTYELVEVSGAPHDQCFRVSCRIAGDAAPEYAEGTSRRGAEQSAARAMLARLGLLPST